MSANRARLTVTGVQLKYLVFLLSSNNNNRSDNDCLTKINCLAKTFILTTWTNAVQTISESQTLSPLTTCLLCYPPNPPFLSSLSLKSLAEIQELSIQLSSSSCSLIYSWFLISISSLLMYRAQPQTWLPVRHQKQFPILSYWKWKLSRGEELDKSYNDISWVLTSSSSGKRSLPLLLSRLFLKTT